MCWPCSLWIGLVEEWNSLDVSANAAADCCVKRKADQSNCRPSTHCPLLDLYRTPQRIRYIHPEDGNRDTCRNFGKTSLFYAAQPSPERNEGELTDNIRTTSAGYSRCKVWENWQRQSLRTEFRRDWNSKTMTGVPERVIEDGIANRNSDRQRNNQHKWQWIR
jgi:hypothetical protein